LPGGPRRVFFFFFFPFEAGNFKVLRVADRFGPQGFMEFGALEKSSYESVSNFRGCGDLVFGFSEPFRDRESATPAARRRPVGVLPRLAPAISSVDVVSSLVRFGIFCCVFGAIRSVWRDFFLMAR